MKNNYCAQRIYSLCSGGRTFLIPMLEVIFVSAYLLDCLTERGDPKFYTCFVNMPEASLKVRGEAVDADKTHTRAQAAYKAVVRAFGK